MATTHPTGTVTFLFTDIEGSAKLAREHPETWESARARHHAILHGVIEENNGYVFQIIGDAFCAAFHTAGEAVNAAINSQINIYNETWKTPPIKVRMGIHTGTAQAGNMDDRSGGYTGYNTLVLVQRVMSIGYGGQILLSNSSAELVRKELPNKITLRDMGKHQLKGLLNPEPIWQVNIPDLPQEFPPLQSLNIKPNNLPIQLTSFVGREKEIYEVKEMLTAQRLVTLIGPGGTGKTRLSLQTAQELLDEFPDGVWFVELAPILDPLLVPRTTALAIGLRDEPHRPVIDMLCDYLREKKTLIILDNCEHLINACAHIANTILQAASNVRILASSREALGIAGEATYRVPSLGLPELEFPSVESLTEHEATKLFIARAASAVATFSVTEENASSIAQICHRLDGIPLALELAAAKIRVLSIEQIASRLNDRFRLLTGGSRAAMERHQTLRATIDWGYNLLQPAEQIFFRRLSVFVDGWTLEAAESVCELEATSGVVRSDVLHLLEQLINKSFVTKEESGNVARYRMLETIKQYATEKLIEANESDHLRDRHLKHFLTLAETAEPHLLRTEQLEWLAQVDAEYQNLRAAFDWALTKESPASALRLCGALGAFWSIRGYWLEGTKWLSSAFALCTKLEGDDEKAAYVKARYWDADLTYRRDDLERAMLSAELSLTISQERDNKRDIAIARFMVALVHYQREDYQAALPLAERSLIEFQELHDANWEARAYDIYGRALIVLGGLTSSERLLRKLELTRKAGERNHLADALYIISIWHYTNNRIDEARKFAEEADLMWKQIGAYVNSASITFALIAWSNGEYERAISYYEDMRDRLGWQGEKHMRSGTIACLGKLAMEQGDLAQAQFHLEQALAILREIDFKPAIALRLAELGNLHQLKGDTGKFKQLIKESISMKSLLNKFAKTSLLITLIDSKAIQAHALSIPLLGTFSNLEISNERPLRIMHRAFLFDQAVSRARERFGDSVFESAFTEGQKMSLDEALDLALKKVEEI